MSSQIFYRIHTEYRDNLEVLAHAWFSCYAIVRGRGMRHRLIAIVLVLGLFGASMHAQAPLQHGLSRGVYWTTQVTGLAAAVTQEWVFAEAGASKRFVGRRLAWGAANVAGPWVCKKLTRDMLRTNADSLCAGFMSFYVPQVGWNIYYIVKLRKD